MSEQEKERIEELVQLRKLVRSNIRTAEKAEKSARDALMYASQARESAETLEWHLNEKIAKLHFVVEEKD